MSDTAASIAHTAFSSVFLRIILAASNADFQAKINLHQFKDTEARSMRHHQENSQFDLSRINFEPVGYVPTGEMLYLGILGPDRHFASWPESLDLIESEQTLILTLSDQSMDRHYYKVIDSNEGFVDALRAYRQNQNGVKMYLESMYTCAGEYNYIAFSRQLDGEDKVVGAQIPNELYVALMRFTDAPKGDNLG